jgi:hypothetical protein
MRAKLNALDPFSFEFAGLADYYKTAAGYCAGECSPGGPEPCLFNCKFKLKFKFKLEVALRVVDVWHWQHDTYKSGLSLKAVSNTHLPFLFCVPSSHPLDVTQCLDTLSRFSDSGTPLV